MVTDVKFTWAFFGREDCYCYVVFGGFLCSSQVVVKVKVSCVYTASDKLLQCDAMSFIPMETWQLLVTQVTIGDKKWVCLVT